MVFKTDVNSNELVDFVKRSGKSKSKNNEKNHIFLKINSEMQKN